ncbi:MAG TPA: HD domain-containing phosphohydrolase [Nitrospirota bacterium]|nr:HD domain-containing phosphohydrolase [Nitrospirota bacterium]
MADEHGDKRGEVSQSFFAKQQLIDAARTVFQMLSAVLKNATLYPEAHPILLTAADRLLSRIEDLFPGRNEVAFYLVGGELFFEKISIPIDQALSLLMEFFSSRAVGGITFRPALTAEELIRFSALMNREPALFTGAQDLSDIIVKADIHHIDLHRVVLVDKQSGSDIKAGMKKASDIFREAVAAVKDMVKSVHLGKALNVRKMNSIVQTMVDSMLDNRDALLGLTNIKMFDEYTFAHSVNTSILAVSLGAYLAFEKPRIAALGIAGLMHDIGKVNVPPEIINKPGALTEEEWAAIKRHPIEGALMLADTPGMSKLAMICAFEHHQQGGLRSYPQIDGEVSQHPFTQILSLVDAYEAMTAARVYYQAQMPVDQAVRILLKKRSAPFNPVLVKAFVNMIGLFPIGTVLKLDTGEIGLVVHQTADLMRPKLLLLTKFDGSEKAKRTEISLIETSGGRYLRSIVGTIDPSAARINVKQYLE